MGSRAIAVVCRDDAVAAARFGATSRIGRIYTRTGRPFFNDDWERLFLGRLAMAVDSAGLFEELQSGWIVLDVEILPWNVKAETLVRDQFAAVGTAGAHGLAAELSALRRAGAGEELDGLRARTARRLNAVESYVDAYSRYLGPASTPDDVRIAPFHLLASESGVHLRDHRWHMDMLGRLCAADSALLRPTRTREVDTTDDGAIAGAVEWWLELLSSGGEGMVVKPLEFLVRGRRGLLQPALKVRGPEYLRIIYGPDYDTPEHLEQLRDRGLGRKRALASREFALGIEGLQRFARREPLYRVHECAMAVLALECEPVDPRL
jgi:hypothetical protein